MMTKHPKAIAQMAAIGLAATLPFTALAQEKTTESYVYGTYYYCDPLQEDAADSFVAEKLKPVYDQAVEDGTINAWGWLAHHTGGKWRRVLYTSAGSVDALLDSGTALREKVMKAAPDDMRLMSACKMHEDYIWSSNNVGSGGETRGPAGFSVYYECEQNEEARADEIVKEHFAPIYDKLVSDGKLSSWGWSSHFVGGEYRRLATMTGASHKAILAARNAVIEAAYDDDDSKAGAEFTDICDEHVDYMWDIQIEKP